MHISGKTLLVVGASGVLGGSISRLLVSRGARVLGTASSVDSAAAIPAEASLRLLVDLENPTSITTLTDYLKANENIDGIVLAAGRVGFGTALQTSSVDAQRLTQVNYLGQAQLVTQLHPMLQGKGESVIAAITGVVAEKSYPGMAAYCASKQALAGWLDSVSAEWRRDGVQVLDARPGHTETGLAGRPLFGTAPNFPQGMTPDHVARKIVDGIENQSRVLASTDF